MKDFKNKVVAITGGATGIGLSFAKQFGKEGAKIIIGGIEQDRNEEAVEILSKLGIEAKSKLCDVTQRKEVEALAEFAWEKFQNVDVIVNNAGTMSVRKNVIDSTPEDFFDIYNVNVFGVINGSSVFGKRFIMQGTPCAIYNIGSENSLFHGVPTGSAYVSSKHAVLAITESLKEEAPDFMDIGLICPGYVKSELGEKAAMQFAMDTDKFTSIAMQQIKDGKFYIVSHAYNMKRINKRYNEIKEAFEQYAPRYEGDEEFDIRTLMVKLMEQQPSGENK